MYNTQDKEFSSKSVLNVTIIYGFSVENNSTFFAPVLWLNSPSQTRVAAETIPKSRLSDNFLACDL